MLAYYGHYKERMLGTDWNSPMTQDWVGFYNIGNCNLDGERELF